MLVNANCDTIEAQREWLKLKLHVARNNHFRQVHPLAVWQRLSVEDVNIDQFSNILKVIHLTSLYPLSNAHCERGFSVMKRIKSDWRCCLSNDTLNILMRIDIEGPNIADFEPRPVVNRWYISGQANRRPNTMPYGPRAVDGD